MFPNLNKNSATKNKNKIFKNGLIIGVDFGTSGISCAYGVLESENMPISIHFNGKVKIPAEIILDDGLNVKAFGDDCSSYYNSLKEGNLHHFYKIKMNLYEKKYKIKARNSDKVLDIKYVLKLMLIEIKKKDNRTNKIE